MPWQMAPPLIIVGLTFTLTGLGMKGLDYLALGRNRRVRISNFEWGLDRRDDMIRKARIERATDAGDTAEVKRLKALPVTVRLHD